MNTPSLHLLICSSSRVAGEPKGGCQGRGAADLVAYLQEEVTKRGLTDVLVTNTGCLQACDHGPLLVVYPAGQWYGPIDSEAKVDAVLDALEEGGTAEELLLNA
jgi:(2Fe-2S) ferredoxin